MPLGYCWLPGGYSYLSEREAERIALHYNAAGFHAAVVWYCVAPHVFPMALKNAAKAVELVRENAASWFADPEQVSVCGFSAGGHVAASLCTLWNDPELFSPQQIEAGHHRPNGGILCYPVITSGDYAHKGSFVQLTGSADETNPLREKVSLEKRVTDKVPPIFLWHTDEDRGVPVENSLLFATALRGAGVPFELHIFDHGAHGLSLATDETLWCKPKFQRAYPWYALSADCIMNL